MISFIIKSTVSLFAIYIVYMIFMAKENAPVCKRYFLLSGIVFSFIISLFQFDLPETPSTMIPATLNYPISEINTSAWKILSRDSSGLEITKQIILLLYLSISSALALRYILNISRLIKASKNARQLDGYKIAILKSDISPYSFFNTIYLNEKDYNNGVVCKEILIHELTHIKQKHSIDILFIEFLQIIFWYNPILLLLKKEIKLNQEYLADQGVIDAEADISDYQNFMLNFAFRNNSSYMASNFNYSFIKKRIIMLKKEKSRKRLFLKGLAIAPLIVLMTIAFTFNSHATPIDSDKWWEPILRKHNIQTTAYNNFGDVFEMGDSNSIDQGICTLTNATMIIKGKGEDYLLIQAERIVHNIQTGLLKIESGTLDRYSQTNSGEKKPDLQLTGNIEMNLK